MKVYELSSMECDYDGIRSTLGLFSSLGKAKEYIESNFKFIEVAGESALSKCLGYAYECNGYRAFDGQNLFEDEDGVYFEEEHDDGDVIKAYITQESLYVKEYEIDSLLATQ